MTFYLRLSRQSLCISYVLTGCLCVRVRLLVCGVCMCVVCVVCVWCVCVRRPIGLYVCACVRMYVCAARAGHIRARVVSV